MAVCTAHKIDARELLTSGRGATNEATNVASISVSACPDKHWHVSEGSSISTITEA